MSTLEIARERDTIIHSTIGQQDPLRTRWCPRWEASKPHCLLHWLWKVAARLMEDAWWQPRQEWKSPGPFLSLNSNPGSAFTWESILDPVIWQLWPSMFLSQMRLRFFKDPFSFKYLWICWSHCTQIDVECWTNCLYLEWLITSRTLLGSVHYQHMSKDTMKIFYNSLLFIHLA